MFLCILYAHLYISRDHDNPIASLFLALFVVSRRHFIVTQSTIMSKTVGRLLSLSRDIAW